MTCGLLVPTGPISKAEPWLSLMQLTEQQLLWGFGREVQNSLIFSSGWDNERAEKLIWLLNKRGVSEAAKKQLLTPLRVERHSERPKTPELHTWTRNSNTRKILHNQKFTYLSDSFSVKDVKHSQNKPLPKTRTESVISFAFIWSFVVLIYSGLKNALRWDVLSNLLLSQAASF